MTKVEKKLTILMKDFGYKVNGNEVRGGQISKKCRGIFDAAEILCPIIKDDEYTNRLIKITNPEQGRKALPSSHQRELMSQRWRKGMEITLIRFYVNEKTGEETRREALFTAESDDELSEILRSYPWDKVVIVKQGRKALPSPEIYPA